MTRSCNASPRNSPLPYSDNLGSVEIMRSMDRLSPPWRALIHEFGWSIVRDMRLDGHCDAAKLREDLIAWRKCRQEAWLAEIPYPAMRRA